MITNQKKRNNHRRKKYTTKYSLKMNYGSDLSNYNLDSFKETFEDSNFSDGKTALVNSRKKLKEVLLMLKSRGIEKIAVLTRRIDRIYMNSENGVVDKKYKVELSFHLPGIMDELLMYDASLVNYHLGSESKEFSEIIFSTLSLEEGRALEKYTIEDIENLTQIALDRGDRELAIKIYCTWKTYQTYNY